MDDDAILREIRALTAQGQKIEAIKRYRERWGVGLAEAKSAVEAIERSGPPPSSSSSGVDERAGAQGGDSDVLSLLQAGRNAEAIRLHRRQTGASSGAAKEHIRDLAQKNGLAVPTSGCFGTLLLLATGLLTAVGGTAVVTAMGG